MENLQPDLLQYAQLRTMLDSVQTGALRQYLNAPSQAERDASFNYLKTNLKPIHDYVRGMNPGDSCPVGEYDCGTYCSLDPCVCGGGGVNRG
jgi:hypothetical protein